MSLDFIKQNVNYSEDTYSLILDQFADKTYYKKFVNTLMFIQQDYERLLVELATSRRLPLAEGQQLTDIGEEIGLARTTDDDNDFRAAIYLSSIKRHSDGTRDVIASALYQSTGYYPYLYSGLYKSVDVMLNGEVIPSVETLVEVVNLLPVNTAYRIIKNPRSGKPWGFNGNSRAGGMGSRTTTATSNVGTMSSLKLRIPKPEGRGTTYLPYVASGYVDIGYIA